MDDRKQAELNMARVTLSSMRAGIKNGLRYGCFWEDARSLDPHKAHRCLDCEYPDKDDYCIKAKKACLVLQGAGMEPVAPVEFREGMPAIPGVWPRPREEHKVSEDERQEIESLPIVSGIPPLGWNLVISLSDGRRLCLAASEQSASFIKDKSIPVLLVKEIQLLAEGGALADEAIRSLVAVKSAIPGSTAVSVEKNGAQA